MNTNGSSGLSKHELFHFSQCLWLEFGFIIMFIELKFLCNSKQFLVFEFVSLGSLDPPYAHAGCKNNTHQFFLIHRDARASLFAIAPNTRAHVHMHACTLLFPTLAIRHGDSLARSRSACVHLRDTCTLLIQPACALPLHHNWVRASCGHLYGLPYY